MKQDNKNGKNEYCTVIHCENLAVSDGYCETHLERLDLIKESYEQVKQMQLRAREDEKENSIEQGQEPATTFGPAQEYIE